MKLVLASSSAYRKKLLQTLIPTIDCIAPEIDESSHSGEFAADYVTRLSIKKAQSVACDIQDALVIGSDQCAELDGKIITKPINHAEAFRQLSAASGKNVTFYTGLCMVNTNKKSSQFCYEPYQVKFRNLSNKQIEAYLQRDKPYNCAGSFKVESMGIALFEKMHGDDPNTLIGLPMIKLISMLHKEGIDILTNPTLSIV